MSIIGTIYDDVTTDVLGLIGRWQWFATLISTAFMFGGFFNPYENMFLIRPSGGAECSPVDDFEPYNGSLCYITNGTEVVKCKKWNVRLMGLIWLKKSWLVFCGDDSQMMSMTMVCRLGSAFGCVIFGIVADSFGRKKSLAIGLFIELPLRLIITFCDSDSWVKLLIFLSSLFGSANIFMGLIIVCEISSNAYRTSLISFVVTPQILSSVFTMPLINYLPNIETFTFIGSLYLAGLVVALRWLPESPHWLIYNRKIHIAESLLYNAAKKNKIDLYDDFKIRPVNRNAFLCIEASATCIEVLSTYNIRVIVLVTMLFSICFEYVWNVLYFMASMKSERNILLLTVGTTTVTGFVTVLLCYKLKLRNLLLINVLVMGVLTSADVPIMDLSNESIHTIVCSFALSSGLIIHYMILNIAPRLFAIQVRGTLVGSYYALGNLGGMIGIFSYFFEYANRALLVGIVATLTAFMGALCLFLPDVDGRELPDVMEDMDYFMELSKPIRWATQKTNSPSRDEVEITVHSFGSGQGPSPMASIERVPPKHIGWRVLWLRITSNLFKKKNNS